MPLPWRIGLRIASRRRITRASVSIESLPSSRIPPQHIRQSRNCQRSRNSWKQSKRATCRNGCDNRLIFADGIEVKGFRDREAIASRRSGGHILGICKGGNRRTGAVGQTDHGNQSALHSRYHRKGTYASVLSQDRPACKAYYQSRRHACESVPLAFQHANAIRTLSLHLSLTIIIAKRENTSSSLLRTIPRLTFDLTITIAAIAFWQSFPRHNGR